MSITVRKATTRDVVAIRELANSYTQQRILLAKENVSYYEDIQEFRVAVETDANGQEEVLGCGALHVLWEDLAEVRTLAARPEWRGKGVGHKILSTLIEDAIQLRVERVFCLTFEVEFFERHGFELIEGAPVSPEVYQELLRSQDEGVAEFLDLARAKPNTLGNSRMLLNLPGAQSRS